MHAIVAYVSRSDGKEKYARDLLAISGRLNSMVMNCHDDVYIVCFLYSIVLHCAVLCCIVLYCAVLCGIVLYCAVLCCIVWCCAVLGSIVLYCAVFCIFVYL